MMCFWCPAAAVCMRFGWLHLASRSFFFPSTCPCHICLVLLAFLLLSRSFACDHVLLSLFCHSVQFIRPCLPSRFLPSALLFLPSFQPLSFGLLVISASGSIRQAWAQATSTRTQNMTQCYHQLDSALAAREYQAAYEAKLTLALLTAQ